MFWTGGVLGEDAAPEEIAASVASLGVTCGQLGVHGAADLSADSAARWKAALASRGIEVVTAFMNFKGGKLREHPGLRGHRRVRAAQDALRAGSTSTEDIGLRQGLGSARDRGAHRLLAGGPGGPRSRRRAGACPTHLRPLRSERPDFRAGDWAGAGSRTARFPACGRPAQSGREL